MPRISQLPSLTTADNADEIAIVDVSASTTKKITRGDLMKAPLPNNSVTTAAIADGTVTAAKIDWTNSILVGHATRNTSQQSITGEVDLNGMTLTVNVPAGRKLKLSASLYAAGGIAAGQYVYRFKEGTTLLKEMPFSLPNTTNAFNETMYCTITPSAGSHTYKITMQSVSSGTVQNFGAAGGYTNEFIAELV